MSSTSLRGLFCVLPGHVNAIHNLVNQILLFSFGREVHTAMCFRDACRQEKEEVILQINDEKFIAFLFRIECLTKPSVPRRNETYKKFSICLPASERNEKNNINGLNIFAFQIILCSAHERLFLYEFQSLFKKRNIENEFLSLSSH